MNVQKRKKIARFSAVFKRPGNRFGKIIQKKQNIGTQFKPFFNL